MRLDDDWSCEVCGSDEDPCACPPGYEPSCGSCGFEKADDGYVDCIDCRGAPNPWEDGTWGDDEERQIRALLKEPSRG